MPGMEGSSHDQLPLEQAMVLRMLKFNLQSSYPHGMIFSHDLLATGAASGTLFST